MLLFGYSTVYVNRDQLTGFGTPWEIRFESNYTILRKGGNVDGYSALFSYIPDLQLGKSIRYFVVVMNANLPPSVGQHLRT